MLIFYSLILLILFQAVIIPQNTERGKRTFLIWTFFELQFVSGFRVADEGDTYQYMMLYTDIASMSFSEVLSFGTELGYYLMNFFLSRFSSNPQTIIFFTSALINLLVLRFIYKKSNVVWLSVVVYITFMFFFNSLNLVRNTIAYTILLYSNEYIINRKFLKFSLVVLLAASFHFSAFLYFCMYFVYQLKIKKTNIATISIGILTAMAMLTPLLNLLVTIHPRWTSYAENDFYQSAYANILIFIIQLAVFFLAIKRENTRLSKLSDENRLYMWLLFMSVIMSFCAINVMMIVRFISTFSLISIIYIPNLLLNPSKRSLNPGWTSMVLIVSVLQMVIILAFRPEWYFAGDYRLVFFE